MKKIRHHLQRLTREKRKRRSPLLHTIHKTHGISKKTLFYVKEYGPHANVPRTIIRESLKIMLFASLVSSVGGLALEQIKIVFLSLTPLIILLPALNDMVGDYGTIMSSRFSTLLHEGHVTRRWWTVPPLKKLFIQIFLIALITSVLGSGMALALAVSTGGAISLSLVGKILFISLLDVVLLISLMIFLSTTAGIYFYKKQEDPNNFLIPITTSVADFGNMIVLSLLVLLFF